MFRDEGGLPYFKILVQFTHIFYDLINIARKVRLRLEKFKGTPFDAFRSWPIVPREN